MKDSAARETSPASEVATHQHLAAIVEYCEDAVISVSLDGRVASWNSGATALFGYSRDEMIGAPITRIIPPARHAEEDDILSRIRDGLTVRPFDTQRVCKDGSVIDISLTVSPVKDASGRVIAGSKVARSITDRKRFEEARRRLIECSQLVGGAFFSAVVGAVANTLNVRWVLLCELLPGSPRRARTIAAWADGGLQENFAYDLAGTPCANVTNDQVCFYPESVADLFPDDALLAEMGATSYLGVPLRASDGRMLGFLAVLHDAPLGEFAQPHETLELFSGRSAAELERLATASLNERLGRIIEDAASETFVFDAETLRFLLVNRGARENLGYAMSELEALTPLDIKPKMTVADFDTLLGPLRSGETSSVSFQTVHRRKDGSDYDVDVKLQLLRDGEQPVFYATIEDITERQAAARAFQDISRRLDTILNNTTMAVFLMDDRQECIYMNDAAERLTGYRFDEVTGRPLHDVIHHSHPDGRRFPLADCAIDRAFPTDNQVQGEETFIHKDGRFYPVAYTASPIHDESGKPVGTVIEARDIEAEILVREALHDFNSALQNRVEKAVAERNAVEMQFRQAQKMESIGQLTGGVAHDFNNLLQVIGANLQLLSRDIGGNQRAEQRVQNAMAGVSRGAKLASQLLAFSRNQPLAPRVVNLGRLLHGMDDMLRRTLGETVDVETIISDALWNACVDDGQVENAIVNLAINARDAMDGHGKLTIEAGNAVLDARYANQHADVNPGDYVMLAVTDTGCGIPRDQIDRVIEPFYTTKPVGKGTGLGLSMVYGLVKQSGGHIQIYSEVGEGTTIRIYFPRVFQQEAAKKVETLSPVTGGSETILVVEDDDDVREAAVEMLAELGYHVLKARDANAALTVIDSGVPINLLFSDVVMPGPLRSQDLARQVKARFPGIAILFTSGYTVDAIVHGGRVDEGVELLSKPYTREALAAKVRHCIEGSAAVEARSVGVPGNAVTRARRLSVLLVEDEIIVRAATAAMLEDLGHRVIEAGEGDEAIAILEAGGVDVLVTDIGLPGMSGSALATLVRSRWPSIRIVIASGLNEQDDGIEAAGEPIAWLQKPYDIADLVNVLGQ